MTDGTKPGRVIRFKRLWEYSQPEPMYAALEDERVDAVVYDAPALKYYASHAGQGRVKLVGGLFQRQSYRFAFPKDSPDREAVDIALLELMEDGRDDELRSRWFGAGEVEGEASARSPGETPG